MKKHFFYTHKITDWATGRWRTPQQKISNNESSPSNAKYALCVRECECVSVSVSVSVFFRNLVSIIKRFSVTIKILLIKNRKGRCLGIRRAN